MALDNYSNLVQSIKKWIHRDDLDEGIPDIIRMVENDFYSTGNRVLRVHEMEALAELTAAKGDREVILPDDYLETRSLKLNSIGLRAAPPENLKINTVSGTPCSYAVTDAIYFDYAPDSDYPIELWYYKKFDSLSEDCPENDILTNYPNIYLYGAMSKGFEFAGEEQKAQYYDARFMNAIKKANRASKHGRLGKGLVRA